MSSWDLPRIIGTVAGERLLTPIRKPIPKLKPIRLRIRQHLLVIALQADHGTRRVSLKVEQALHHAPAVWPTVDVVPNEDEACVAVASKVPAAIQERVQFIAAAMDVSDGKREGTRFSLTGTSAPTECQQLGTERRYPICS